MWSRGLVVSKLKASAIHLSLSAVAFMVVLYFILERWYPQPWFIDGGWQGVRIMTGVDLVLGPTLTFIVFNAAKTRRALLFDFTVIGLAQLCAFVWGVYAVHGQRPVAIAYWSGAFYSFEEKSLLRQGHTAADLKALDSHVPAVIYGEEPATREARQRFLKRLTSEDLAGYEMLELLRPLAPYLDQVWERSDALAELLWADPHQAAKLDRILADHPGLKREDLRFAWFIGRYEDATLVMSKDGEVLGTVGYVQPKKAPNPQGNNARRLSAI